MDEEVDDIDSFWSNFNQLLLDLRTLLDDINSDNYGEILKTSKVAITELQTFATRYIHLLPPFDIKRSQRAIFDLSRSCKGFENQFLQRKRFTFRSRSRSIGGKQIPSSTPPKSSLSSSLSPLPKLKDESPKSSHQPFVISNKSNSTVTYSSELLSEGTSETSRGVLIKECNDSSVSIPCKIGSVRIENLTNCCVFLGPCYTSVYIESCQGCNILAASHQLRIHSCTDCNLFVRINGHPIIEDCKAMTFGPYSLQYDTIETDFLECELSKSYVWNTVVDFRWHRNSQSPNWRVLNNYEWIPIGVVNPWSVDLKYIEQVQREVPEVMDEKESSLENFRDRSSVPVRDGAVSSDDEL